MPLHYRSLAEGNQTLPMKRSSLRLRLDSGWMRFAQPRADFELIGTVQDGYQIGALGRAADGSYAQVNGDVV